MRKGMHTGVKKSSRNSPTVGQLAILSKFKTTMRLPVEILHLIFSSLVSHTLVACSSHHVNVFVGRGRPLNRISSPNVSPRTLASYTMFEFCKSMSHSISFGKWSNWANSPRPCSCFPYSSASYSDLELS